MRPEVLLVAGLAVVGPSLPAEAQHRELGAHQHGHGTLNIAIEGPRVRLELDMPGADIVGFEHAASTQAQRTAIEQAKARLASPLALFVVPAAAGCTVKDANVKIEGAETTTKGATAAPGDKVGATGDPGAQHSDFDADYTLECTSVDKLTSIEFRYFSVFPGAEELDVNLITPTGQSKFEVKRSNPRIDLAGAR